VALRTACARPEAAILKAHTPTPRPPTPSPPCAAEPQAYDEGLSRQRSLSKEMALLLQRKSAWGPGDVARFTEVYAAEHATEGGVAAAKAGWVLGEGGAVRWWPAAGRGSLPTPGPCSQAAGRLAACLAPCPAAHRGHSLNPAPRSLVIPPLAPAPLLWPPHQL
jgi:hypothetical protein